MVKTLKELNARVDKLHDQFQRNFEDLKRSLSVPENEEPNQTSSGIITESNKKEIKEKLLQLEVDLSNEISEIRAAISEMEGKLSRIQGKQRRDELSINRKSIVIHGLDENLNNSIYKSVTELFLNGLNIEVKKSDISVVYRMGSKKGADKKPRPLIVEFCCQWLRDEIYYSKKALKGTSTFMTEKLTGENHELYIQVRKLVGNSCWTKGGLVYTVYEGKKIAIKGEEELDKLRQKLGNRE